MSLDRFRRRRAVLIQRKLCVRCGRERVTPPAHVCGMCALEKKTKKIVCQSANVKAEKIGRLERNRALFLEGIRAIDSALAELKA